jgi:HD-like signal output (HDOD) protein
MHSILFVDDDPLVIRGLRRSMDALSDTWVVDFASSGQEALVKLAQAQFDAVVTDMHMPGIDGIRLLEAVSRDMPGVMRFVLSGNTNDAQILKSTSLVHQMIPKPCEMEKIYGIVERACRMRDMLSDPHLLRIITGIKFLPSVPLLYNKLVKVLQSEDASAQAAGNIIAQDAAMTAKILQLVNSAFFGLSDKVSKPQRAVTLLGLDTVKSLVLGIQIFTEFQGRIGIPITVDAIWKHSMLVSSLAYLIAKDMNLPPQEREDARVSGILHDVGILLYFKTPMMAIKISFNQNGLISNDSEYHYLATSHSEMGGYLLAIWGLPADIVEAVTYHHRPWMQVDKNINITTILYIANGLANACQFDKGTGYRNFFDMDYVREIGFHDQLETWLAMARNLYKQALNSPV